MYVWSRGMLGSTAYQALRDFVFAVIPLFMLMGEFIGRSGAVTESMSASTVACAASRGGSQSQLFSATRCFHSSPA